MLADRIGGIISIFFGLISIFEAIRLYPTRITFVVGDHILPGFIGLLMVIMGLAIAISPGKKFRVGFPDKKVIKEMVSIFLLLIIYWFALEFLGYLICTLLLLVGLFKIIGQYDYIRSVIYSLISTAVVYLVFIYFLTMPFPRGIFNI